MPNAWRKTGIDVLGDLPWGVHFCLFYKTKKDLLGAVVPYLKAGLESNEFCILVIAEPLTESQAVTALRRAIPDFDRYLARRSIEFQAARDWYRRVGQFDMTTVIDAWHGKLQSALERGYVGMRVTGDVFWMATKDWPGVCAYERELNKAVANRPMIVLCTYALAKTGAFDMLDVARAHHLIVARREGEWEVSKAQTLEDAKQRIAARNGEPQQRHFKNTKRLLADRAHIAETLATLTKRERQVFDRLVSGLPTRSIAFDLGLSPRTVEVYRANVMRKMKAPSMPRLLRMALIMDIVRDTAGFGGSTA